MSPDRSHHPDNSCENRPEDEFDAYLTATRAAFIEDLGSLLDLTTSATEATHPATYAALINDLSQVLDLDTSLAAILAHPDSPSSAVETPPSVASDASELDDWIAEFEAREQDFEVDTATRTGPLQRPVTIVDRPPATTPTAPAGDARAEPGLVATGVLGPYRLLSRLGTGGMGEVWRALDTNNDREVAVKVLGAGLGTDPGYAARFRREAALAARLNAPNIVPIHNYGEIDGRLFIEMQLITGTDLAALIATRGPLDPARAIEVIGDVAAALDAAHAEGLVHRDVKPSNVLISTNGGTEHAYLIDFGLARALDGTSSVSQAGALIGTLAYMAPERFGVSGGDHRGDVYALACTLFEALTGQAPFAPPDGAESLASCIDAHLHRPPPAPSAGDATIPAALDAVIARGMAKDPDERYPSAGALMVDARAAIATRLNPHRTDHGAPHSRGRPDAKTRPDAPPPNIGTAPGFSISDTFTAVGLRSRQDMLLALEVGNWPLVLHHDLQLANDQSHTAAMLRAVLRLVAHSMRLQAEARPLDAWNKLGEAAYLLPPAHRGPPAQPGGAPIAVPTPDLRHNASFAEELTWQTARLVWREQSELADLRRKFASGLMKPSEELVEACIEHLSWIEFDPFARSEAVRPSARKDKAIVNVFRDSRSALLERATRLRQFANPAAQAMNESVWRDIGGHSKLVTTTLSQLAGRVRPTAGSATDSPSDVPARLGRLRAWEYARSAA